MAEAAIANGAAALVAKNLSTFGAMQLVISAENGLVSICGSLSGGLFFFRRFLIHAKSFSIKHFGHFFNGAGNGIGAGGAFHTLLANGAWAAYAFKLSENLFLRNSGTQCNGNKARGRFGLGGASAAFAGACKYFANSVFITVHRDEKASAADFDFFRCAPCHAWAWARHNVAEKRSGNFHRLFVLCCSGGKNLTVAASVTINGGTLTAEFICKQVRLLDLFPGGGVREVYGF